jgi:hypothetical protein
MARGNWKQTEHVHRSASNAFGEHSATVIHRHVVTGEKVVTDFRMTGNGRETVVYRTFRNVETRVGVFADGQKAYNEALRDRNLLGLVGGHAKGNTPGVASRAVNKTGREMELR